MGRIQRPTRLWDLAHSSLERSINPIQIGDNGRLTMGMKTIIIVVDCSCVLSWYYIMFIGRTIDVIVDPSADLVAASYPFGVKVAETGASCCCRYWVYFCSTFSSAVKFYGCGIKLIQTRGLLNSGRVNIAMFPRYM